MKKLYYIFLLFAFVSCGTPQNGNDNFQSNEEAEILEDSLSTKIALYAEMLSKTGTLHELKTYPIGDFKKINFSVQKVTNIRTGTSYLFGQLKVRYEDTYYIYTRNAIIDQAEIPEFIEALNVINNDYLETTPETATIVGFISSGGTRIRTSYEKGKWVNDFNVVYREDKASVSFSRDDIETIINLFKSTSDKIDELK